MLLFDFQGLLEKECKVKSLFTITYNLKHGGVAQLGEHLPCKQGVKGSNPFISTIGWKQPKEAWFKRNGNRDQG